MMMGMMMNGGGKGGGPSASLPVAEDLKELIVEAESRGIRAIKIGIDKKRPRLLLEDQKEATGDFCADFELVDWAGWLQDATACIVLLRTTDEKGSVPGAEPNTFIFCMFMPEGVPVRQKTGFSSALSSMKTALPDITFKEWNVAEREEVTCKEAIDVGGEKSDEERMKLMTPNERAQAEHDQQTAALAAEHEKKRRRLASFKPSFEEAFKALLGETNQALLARMEGFPDNDTVELGGEVLPGISSAADLRGKLPKDDALFVLLREDETLLIVHWNPKGAPEDRRIKASSIIKNLTETIQEKVGNFDICFGEAGSEDQLNDSLGVE